MQKTLHFAHATALGLHSERRRGGLALRCLVDFPQGAHPMCFGVRANGNGCGHRAGAAQRVAHHQLDRFGSEAERNIAIVNEVPCCECYLKY